MFISLAALKRAKREDVIRLARYVGFADSKMHWDELITELHIRLNWG